jgi:hypothetical protein
MGFPNLWQGWEGLMYKLLGMGTPRVPLEDFAPIFARVIDRMLPVSQIIQTAGVDLQWEWEPALEQEIIDACVKHISELWQPAHNSLNSVKPERQYQRLHRKAMITSRAYGETLVTYIVFKTMFLSSQFLTKAYFRKAQDGRQWDDITREHALGLVEELNHLARHDTETARLLLPSGNIPEGLELIAREKPLDVLPRILTYAVAPFDG